MSQNPQNFYHLMLGLPADVSTPDYYALLGLDRFEDDAGRVHSAAIDRNRQLLSWQNSEFHREADRLMDEIVAAREALSDPRRKEAYDRRLGRDSEVVPVATPAPTTDSSRPARPDSIIEVTEWLLFSRWEEPVDLPNVSQPVSDLVAEGSLPALLVAPFEVAQARAAQLAWAQALGRSSPVEQNSIGMDLILIPPGRFMMGSPASDSSAFQAPRSNRTLRLALPVTIPVGPANFSKNPRRRNQVGLPPVPMQTPGRDASTGRLRCNVGNLAEKTHGNAVQSRPRLWCCREFKRRGVGDFEPRQLLRLFALTSWLRRS